ncbi:hypothetical protein CerSpe_145520 [Prunus speciosa]
MLASNHSDLCHQILTPITSHLPSRIKCSFLASGFAEINRDLASLNEAWDPAVTHKHCVELDLAKPLTPFIEIEGRTYGVVYEGINLVCFECGCFGHGRDTCPIILQPKQQVPESDNADGMEDISTVQVDVNVDAATKEAEVSAKMHGEWMLMKPRNFRKKSMNDIGKGADLSKRNTKDAGNKAVSPVFGSRFNVLNEEVGREEDMDGSTPVKNSGSSSKRQGSSAKVKGAGVKSSSSRDFGTWVFKKPLKDITNSVVATSGGGGVKNGSVLRRPWMNRAGAKPFSFHDIEPVGLQVNGSDVQDDVRGKFSFNLGGSLFPKLPLGKGGLFFGHEPPDISEMGISEVEPSDASDMDHQGNFSEHCESDTGLEADSSFENDGSEAVEAEHVQI